MRLIAAFIALALALLCSPAEAQSTMIVTSCGDITGTTAAWSAGDRQRPLVMDTNGKLCGYPGMAQQVADTPTVQNAAYASGNCIGGFRAVTVAAVNGQSLFMTNFRLLSLSGQTPTITVYAFDSNPSASTCTDKSTFTLNSADVDKLIAPPTAVTLAAPTGTTVSFGSLDFTPPRPFIAGGAANSGVKTLYYGLVSGSAFTPGSTTDIHSRIGAALN